MEPANIVCGEYSYRIPSLLSNKRSGHVHSIFSNGFNIQMDDSLVFIGNKKSGLLPFGIHLQVDMAKVVPLVTQREVVSWNEGKFSLELPHISISLKNGRSFTNGISSLNSNKDIHLGFIRLLSLLTSIDDSNGLDVDIASFVEKINTGDPIKKPEPEKYLFRLINVAVSHDHYLIEKTLRYFLGRGKGLTPSGDDLLVGFLAFDSIVHFVSPLFYQMLSELLENEPITTDVSREYLRYALNHEFSSTVTDVVNKLGRDSDADFCQAFERLLSVGHSSGLDTLFGILIGMLAFKNPLEQ